MQSGGLDQDLLFAIFFEGLTFVHGYVVGLIALDLMLRLLLGSVDLVLLERDYRRYAFS